MISISNIIYEVLLIINIFGGIIALWLLTVIDERYKNRMLFFQVRKPVFLVIVGYSLIWGIILIIESVFHDMVIYKILEFIISISFVTTIFFWIIYLKLLGPAIKVLKAPFKFSKIVLGITIFWLVAFQLENLIPESILFPVKLVISFTALTAIMLYSYDIYKTQYSPHSFPIEVNILRLLIPALIGFELLSFSLVNEFFGHEIVYNLMEMGGIISLGYAILQYYLMTKDPGYHGEQVSVGFNFSY
jgi:hypothetical protein